MQQYAERNLSRISYKIGVKRGHLYKQSFKLGPLFLAEALNTTLSDKTMSDKIFVGQNFSLDKIFVTIGKFRHFCQTKNFVHF